MSRINRIAIRLISQLEDLYIHEDEDSYLGDPRLEKSLSQHQKVVGLRKNKKKLEGWFADRKIPIRIVYANHPNLISVIPKSGVITFAYEPIPDQEPPTAWMIVHNLAHGIFDYIRRTHPHLLQNKVDWNYADWSRKTIGDMALNYNKSRDNEEYKEPYDENPNGVYPTTRSNLNEKITNSIEAFYEIFSQWVVTGHVRLHSKSNYRVREWEKILEQSFRSIVDEVARMGVVIYNV